MATTYVISKDQYSNFHTGGKPVLYAKATEPVTLVAEHGEVWIVERKDSVRFPILKQNIIELKNDSNAKS